VSKAGAAPSSSDDNDTFTAGSHRTSEAEEQELGGAGTG